MLAENKEDSFLQDISILAVATVTQLMILMIQPELKGITSLPLRVSVGTWVDFWVVGGSSEFIFVPKNIMFIYRESPSASLSWHGNMYLLK